ncbi:MAG TPA: family 10 glycosylhydrolase [Phycisphaerae bacterium]|nr:family 10 glycosylhydrolase [Phycisphaerae bacterium]
MIKRISSLQLCRIRTVSTIVMLAPVIAIGQVITIDNDNANNVGGTFSVISGTWTTGSASSDKYLNDYRFIDVELDGQAEVEWRPTITTPGNYHVEVYYPQGGNRSPNAPFTVHHANGTVTAAVNQQSNGGQWNSIGTYAFNSGSTGYVSLGNNASPVVVLADAVRFSLDTPTTEPEFRGMWISRFEWPSTNLSTVQSRIASMMSNLEANNFNAAVFQVRGQADTLYPSPFEVWSNILSNNGNAPPGWGSFDPMQYAIDQAHLRGLEFHAYINTHVAWQATCAVPATKPTYTLNHIFWDHFDADNPNARDWLIHDQSGTPIQCEESSYTWIAPGVPDASAYTRKQIMYVVENYDVDGVHFDRIRTPGTEYSHDPISEARFNGEGNPDGLSFANWTRDQFTRMLCDVYAQIMEVRPEVKVSSAPLGLYQSSSYPGYPGACGFLYGRTCAYQDAQAWLAAGAQDFIAPQIYWADGGANPDFSEVLPDWVANNAGRHIYAGQTDNLGVGELVSQISATRTLGGEGNVVFSYGDFNNNNFWPVYSNPGGPYETPVATPPMPWKDSPTDGILIGNVTELGTGVPIVDAHVTRNGSTYTALSSGDGLYSMLKVPPGTYTLSFDKPSVGSKVVTDVEVIAGLVTRVDVELGAPPIQCDIDDDGDVDADDFALMGPCLLGPSVNFPNGNICLDCDLDGDNDLDLIDYGIFQELVMP